VSFAVLSRKSETAAVKAKVTPSALRVGKAEDAFEREGGRDTMLAQGDFVRPQWSLSGMTIEDPGRVTARPIQTKLAISTPGDEAEQEAERISEQVMRMPEQPILGNQSVGRRLQTKQTVSSAGRQPEPGPGQPAAPPIVDRALRSPGQPLDRATRDFMEPRFGSDFGGIRIHTGTDAAKSAHAVNALAYTVGSSIVFGTGHYSPHTTTGRRLLAHELVHAVQQTGQEPPHSSTVSIKHPKDSAELNAGRGGAFSASISAGAVASNQPLKIARFPIPLAGAKIAQTSTAPSTLIIEALTRPFVDDEIDEHGRPVWHGMNPLHEVDQILAKLPMQEALKALDEVRSRGFFDLLVERVRRTPVYLSNDRSVTALYTVRWTHEDAGKESIYLFQEVATAIGHLPESDQNELIAYLRANSTSPEQAELIIEGLTALDDGKVPFQGPDPEPEEPSGAGAGSYSTPSTLPPIEPGPVDRPGNQYWAYYIGNEAHDSIAEIYAEEHSGDVIFYNYHPISSILGSPAAAGWSPIAKNLTRKERRMKPDIANLTKQHLYEIKPWRRQGEAIAESQLYIALLTRAGIPMSAGPTTEPGTRGAMPAPDGVFIFASLVPGTIVYRYYQRQSLEPELVPQAEGERVWRYKLTPVQKAVMVTTTGVGIGVIIVMALFFPVTGV